MTNNQIIYNRSDFYSTEIVEENFFNRGKICTVSNGQKDHCPYPAYHSIYSFNKDFKDYVQKNNSVKGYSGPHFSDVIIVDIDGTKTDDINITESLECVRVATLHNISVLQKLSVNNDQIKVFFSGGRGFHIEMPRDLIKNCTPSENFNEIDKTFIMNLFGKSSYVDLSIYKITGLIRVENSLHQKSGLYKIPLSINELENLSAEEIMQLAKEPRTLLEDTKLNTNISPNEEITKIYVSAINQIEENRQRILKAVYSNKNEMANNNKYYSDVELSEVCEFISQQKTSYDDWVVCLYACASFGKRGREYFHKISNNSFFPNDSPETLDEKFDDALMDYDPDRNHKCTASSLFRIAIKYGYTYQKNFSLTEEGNRERFIHENGNGVKYNIDTGQWHYFNNYYWKVDTNGIISKCVDNVTHIIKKEIENNPLGDYMKALRTHYKMSCSRNGRNAIVELAKNDGRMIMENSDFNNQPSLFNCKNGTIELLENGDYKFLPHNRENYLTKIAAVTYDPNAVAANWLEFLNVIFNNDKDLIKYFQKALGYSITGYTDENVLFFLVGDGANGKTTMLEILKLFLGDYCKKSKVNILLKNRSEATGMDVARLTGARVVVCTETDLGTSFDESKIKDLTGGDTLVARKLYKDYFEFKPEFKLWMYGNNKPRIKGNDYGIKRRIKIIPFTVQIPEDKRVPQSKIINQMKEEFSGILNWVLEGYRLYKLEGLSEPDSVKSATGDYFKNLDVVGKFLDEWCLLSPGFEIQVQRLYEGFKLFMQDIGEYPWTRTAFNEELLRRKFNKRIVGSRGYQWFGITIKETHNIYSERKSPPESTPEGKELDFPKDDN